MGGNPYWYTVPYEADIAAALEKLRQREFAAGRYNPVIPFPNFPVDANAPAPGRQHASIDEALDASEADGTRSILDIAQVADAPFDGSQQPFFTAFPVAESDLQAWFGTTRPTRENLENNDSMFEQLERGSAIYIVLFADNQPSEILFAGYSFD